MREWRLVSCTVTKPTYNKVNVLQILLGERAHLIEFPSILLPPGATAGSIVNISVHRNLAEEKRRDTEFWALQKEIYDTFGVDVPKPPELKVCVTSVNLFILEERAYEHGRSCLDFCMSSWHGLLSFVRVSLTNINIEPAQLAKLKTRRVPIFIRVLSF
jgi:hypothetical protein